MRINYIFILKEKSGKKVRNNIEHKEFLKQICEEVEEYYFRIKNNKHQIKYNVIYNYNDKNAFSFNIELERRNETSGKILSEVNKLITKGRHRSDYHIVTVYDEVSEYYCEKGYKISAKWERKLRELIYRIFIKAYGEQWYNEVFSKEFKNTINERAKGKNNRLIENALQELTISDLECFLFTPYSDKNLDEVLVKGDLSKSIIFSKSKFEIFKILDDCRPKSLWERFFKDVITIKDVNNKISEIRMYRNKIAHNKEFSLDEYNDFNKIVKSMDKNIDKAIEKTTNIKIASDNISISDLLKRMREIGEHAKEIQDRMSEIYSFNQGFKSFILGSEGKFSQSISSIVSGKKYDKDTELDKLI